MYYKKSYRNEQTSEVIEIDLCIHPEDDCIGIFGNGLHFLFSEDERKGAVAEYPFHPCR
jgi:hypothetical protein